MYYCLRVATKWIKYVDETFTEDVRQYKSTKQLKLISISSENNSLDIIRSKEVLYLYFGGVLLQIKRLYVTFKPSK